MTKKTRNQFILNICLVAVVLIAACAGDSYGFWPFTSEKKKDYLVRVGSEIITKAEFIESVNRLHTTNRVGKALSEEKSFVRQDYAKFLDELIENKLMIVEALNLGLDQEPDFTVALDNYKVNQSLEKLHQEEVLSKVSVSAAEIEERYAEQLKKKAEEKKDDGKEDLKKEDTETDKDKKDETKKINPRERENIRNVIFAEKSRVREKEYFDSLRQNAKIVINEDILNDLLIEKTELFDKTVAEVNGEMITGRDLLRVMSSSKTQDIEAKKASLDMLILHKNLDQEALKRKYYETDGTVKEKVRKYREHMLIDHFRRKAVLPLVKVTEKDLQEYYAANKEKYKESDRAHLRMIHVTGEDEANTIADDLRKGADFAYIAKEKSIDPSKENAGEVGWVPVNRLGDDMQKAVAAAKKGDILGPFAMPGRYVILEVVGMEKGEYIPVEKVRDEIDKTIGRERFKDVQAEYIKKLRETVPIDINKKELDAMQGK